jgi:hypothetical protein
LSLRGSHDGAMLSALLVLLVLLLLMLLPLPNAAASKRVPDSDSVSEVY